MTMGGAGAGGGAGGRGGNLPNLSSGTATCASNAEESNGLTQPDFSCASGAAVASAASTIGYETETCCEAGVLLAFKASGTDPDGKLSTWLDGTDPCGWTRVTCYADGDFAGTVRWWSGTTARG